MLGKLAPAILALYAVKCRGLGGLLEPARPRRGGGSQLSDGNHHQLRRWLSVSTGGAAAATFGYLCQPGSCLMFGMVGELTWVHVHEANGLDPFMRMSPILA